MDQSDRVFGSLNVDFVNDTLRECRGGAICLVEAMNEPTTMPCLDSINITCLD